MLCKKHMIEESNSSDCESCGLEFEIKKLEAENKKILHMHGVNEAFEGYRKQIKELKAENSKLYELLDRIKYLHSIEEAIELVQRTDEVINVMKGNSFGR